MLRVRRILHFEDGTTAEADIVIGCDGIKSRVRRGLGFSDSPTYSGQVVYRGFVEYQDLPENTATLLSNVVNFRSPKRHLLCLPIGNPATNTDRVRMARTEITTLHDHVRD
ncbi:unnamed protein product [Penicillium palitans]